VAETVELFHKSAKISTSFPNGFPFFGWSLICCFLLRDQ
jgi:hypothetical protein